MNSFTLGLEFHRKAHNAPQAHRSGSIDEVVRRLQEGRANLHDAITDLVCLLAGVDPRAANPIPIDLGLVVIQVTRYDPEEIETNDAQIVQIPHPPSPNNSTPGTTTHQTPNS